MSTGTIERTEKKTRRRRVVTPNGNILGAPPLPQVDLLPDATRAKHALRRIKSYLLLGLTVVVLGLMLLYVFSVISASNAAKEVEIADIETRRLLAEQAKYSEVPKVLGQIEASKQAEFTGMQDEVLWAFYVREIQDILPQGASLSEITTSSQTPLEMAPLPAELLYDGGLGILQITHRSPTVPDTSEWLDSLNAIEGFNDASFTQATLNDDDGNVFYEVSTTVQVTNNALSGRFVPQEVLDSLQGKEPETDGEAEPETAEED